MPEEDLEADRKTYLEEYGFRISYQQEKDSIESFSCFLR